MLINHNHPFGLALGSGGARGLTHIGVLKAIEEYKMEINYISGSSIGALVGALYSLGLTANEIESIALKTNWKQMIKLLTPSITLSSLINDNYLKEFLYSIFGDKQIEDLKIPFSAVACDIVSGKTVVIESGNLVNAIRASISIPVLFSPVDFNNYKLVDGGLTNPTPIDILKNKNIEHTIAVNLRRFGNFSMDYDNEIQISEVNSDIKIMPLNDKIKYFIKNPLSVINSNKKKSKNPKVNEILNQMMQIVQIQISDLTMQIHKPDILIEPDTGDYTLFDFIKAKQLIEIGYDTAIKQFEVFSNNFSQP